MGGRTVVKYVRLPKELVDAIECFQRQEKYRTFVEAVTELVRRGLLLSRQFYGFDPEKCGKR